MMMDKTKDKLLLYKPEVFVYKIPKRIQEKIGHTHRAKDWNVSNPDWYGQLQVLSAGNSCMVLQLQNQPGDIFGECSVENYPGSSIHPVKDSTRYFVLRVQTREGGNDLYGLAFTSRADSEDLIKTLKEYFLKNVKMVDPVVPCLSPSQKSHPDDIVKSPAVPVLSTTPVILNSVPPSASSSPKRKLKPILKKPSLSNGPVRLNRDFGAAVKSSNTIVKRVQVGSVEIIEFESDIIENNSKKLRFSPPIKQTLPEDELLSSESTLQEVENEGTVNIVLHGEDKMEVDNVDEPTLLIKCQENLTTTSNCQYEEPAEIVTKTKDQDLSLVDKCHENELASAAVVASLTQETPDIIDDEKLTTIMNDDEDNTVALESFYSPQSIDDDDDDEMNCLSGEIAMEQKCPEPPDTAITAHVDDSILDTSYQAEEADAVINYVDSPEPQLVSTGSENEVAPLIKSLEEPTSAVVVVVVNDEEDEPLIKSQEGESPVLTTVDQDESTTLSVVGQDELVGVLCNGQKESSGTQIMCQAEDSPVINNAEEEHTNDASSPQTTTQPPKEFNVLQSVMNYLDWADLRSCRLVDTNWQSNASEVMLERDLCAIRLKFDEKSKKFHQVTPWDHNEVDTGVKTLKNLIECIQFGKSLFPCSSVSFQGGDLSAREPQLFFKTFGLQIKTLGILRGGCADLKTTTTTSTQRMKEDSLRKLLLEQVPNVENLEISYFDYKSSKLKQRIKLPYLKSLTCARPPISSLASAIAASSLKLENEIKSTVFQLIQPTPKLNSVHNFKSKYTSRFFLDYHPSKIDFIKSYNLEIVGVKSKHLLKFALSKPKLEKLSVSYQFNPKRKKLKPKQRELAITVLNSILESSKHSIKELYMTALCLLDVTGEQLNIPQLPNLKTLTLSKRWIESGKKGQTASLFPKCVKIQHIFPNLQTVNVFLSCDRDSAWNEYFPSTKTTAVAAAKVGTTTTMPGTFLSVTTLRIGGFCTRLWFQKLRPLFPNVTRLVLISKHSEGWTNMNEMMSGVVHNFPQLEHLEFIGCGWGCGNTSIGNFDTALTGLSRGICQRLSQRCINWPGDILCYRSHPSVTDLKNLRVLKIRISNERWPKDYFSNFNLISWISKDFCFKLVPRLKVIVSYHKFCPSAERITAALTSLAPCVHLIHEKHEEEYV